MSHTPVTVIPGDGIGPEIVEPTLKLLDRLDCGLSYERAVAGQTALDQGLELIPDETRSLLERNAVALKGPITTPVGKGFTSVNVTLRKHFDLYANVRPALSIPGTRARYDDVDIIVVRENIEGIYSGVGQTLSEDGEHAELRSVVTRSKCIRLLRHACRMAQSLGRRKITVVHKANIMKTTSGLFLEAAREVLGEPPELEKEELIVDNCAMQLVMNPERFDVIVTTNLFGDILSDLCAGLVGGLGLAPGGNIGDDKAMFEAVHGSAPDIAGKGIANPAAMMLAAAQMLDHIEQQQAAERLRKAVRDTIAAGDRTTPDLGGKGTTEAFAEAVESRL